MQENSKINFIFKGIEYDFDRNFDTVKIYKESSHLDRLLLKDKNNGLLFLYEFYEWVNFSGGRDEIYTTYALVENEEDADKLNQEGNIKRIPFICIDRKNGIRVYDETLDESQRKSMEFNRKLNCHR